MGQLMKKGEVKVGKAFEGDITITVVVEREPVAKEGFSFKKAAVYIAVALILGVVFSAVSYGMATGDYSVVKGIAEAGKDAIELVVKAAMKSEK